MSVLRAARSISILTLASRGTGLIRDMAFSHVFGVGSVQSAFALAFQVPNLFRMLFGEGAISAASIPVLTEKLQREGPAGLEDTAGRLLGLLATVLTGICLAVEAVLVGVYFLRREDPNAELTLRLTIIMLPFVVMICPVAVMGGIQNIFGRFARTAAMPIVNNVIQIIFAVAVPWMIGVDPRTHVTIIAFAVLLAGLIQLVLQWQGVRGCGIRLRLSLDHRQEAIRRIVVTMVPMMLGLGVVQVNTLMDSLIAWWFVIDEPLRPGLPDERPGTAILYFAQRLYQFPMGVFLVALATASFPALARHAAAEDLAGLAGTLSRSIRASVFISLPCMIGLIFIRDPAVRVLFEHGEFRQIPGAAERVGWAVAMYALGLWAYGLNQLMSRAFYSLQDARTPLVISVGNVFVNLTLNLILVQTPMREAGLALATAIGSTLQFTTMAVVFRRRCVTLPAGEISASLARTLAASAAMAAVVVAVERWLVPGRADIVRLFAMMLAGSGAYFAAAWLLGCREIREILRR